MSSADFVVVYVHRQTKSNRPKSETHSEVGDNDLLEVSIVLLPVEASSDDRIGQRAVERAGSSV